MAKFGIALEWGSRGRWFESSHSDHVGASFISLAPTYFIGQSALMPLLLLSKSNPLTLGFDLVFLFCERRVLSVHSHKEALA